MEPSIAATFVSSSPEKSLAFAIRLSKGIKRLIDKGSIDKTKKMNRNSQRKLNTLFSYILVPLIIWSVSFVSLIVLKMLGRWDLSGAIALVFFLLIPSIIERSNDVLGFKFRPKDNLLVFAISLAFFLSLYLLLSLAGDVDIPYVVKISPKPPSINTIKWFFVFLLGVAIPEEIFFRGFIQGRMNLFFGKSFTLLGTRFGWGLILSSILFMLIHLPQDISIMRFLTFFPGLLFGFIREKYNSIFPAAIFHAMSNTFMFQIVDE